VPTTGLDFLAPAVRTMRNFYGRFGTVGNASIRGVYNGLLPVAVVDRFRDDTEGSLFSLTATAQAIAGSHAAFTMGSVTDDWELHALSWGIFFASAPGSTTRLNLMVYTPDFTFIPVVTPAPAGFFVPGLNPDFAFTLGSLTAIAGHNPTLPGRFGRFPFSTLTMSSLASPPNTNTQNAEVRFDPPIRIYRDVSLGMTIIERPTVAVDHTISATYTIRPRTTPGPSTG